MSEFKVVSTTQDARWPDHVVLTVQTDQEVDEVIRLVDAAPILWKALERIARPHDCGCVPCTGSCTSDMALQITVDEMRELARAAIAKATA